MTGAHTSHLQADARLYRHTPGQSTIQDLGKADGGNSVVWDLEPGANGDIYGGTSANQAANFGSYFTYASNTLTTIKSPVVPNAQYVRAIAHDPAANVTYLGVGSPAALIRSDTNADILPAAYRTSSMVGGLTWTGNRLFMSIDGTLVVMNGTAVEATITTKRVLTEPDWNKVSLAWRDGVLLPIGQYVYGTLGDSIFRISKASREITVLRTVTGMEGLTKDDFGNLYYRIGERLHRFVPPA